MKPLSKGHHSDEDYQAYLDSLKVAKEEGSMSKKEKARWADIWRKYKLTPKQYQKIFDKQNGLCLGCGKVHYKMCVDHDHETGEVRGILCSPCNIALGLLKDSPETLINLARYIKKHTARKSKNGQR